MNHLSDSVSIVDVGGRRPPRVRARCWSATSRATSSSRARAARAFVTAAHRGQNSRPRRSPQLTTPGVGRADVWVFDAGDLGAALGGTPLAIVTLFGDTPRRARRVAGRQRVYAAVFHSGNQHDDGDRGRGLRRRRRRAALRRDGVAAPGGLPAPSTNVEGVPGPRPA